MAETYNLIQTLQKLRDDLKLWSSNNFRNVLSKLSSHEGSAEAHSAVFANYMSINNFASQDPENYKVDHAILADGATLADNANKLNGQPASYYALAEHNHDLADINGPAESTESGTYFIPVTEGTGKAPTWIDEARYALASALNNYQSKLTPGDYIDITNNTIKVKNIDTTVTKNSTNLVTSGAVATALEGVTITLDENITNNSPNPVSGTTIYTYVTGQLANYYTKANTYSKTEVDQMITGGTVDLGGYAKTSEAFGLIESGINSFNLYYINDIETKTNPQTFSIQYDTTITADGQKPVKSSVIKQHVDDAISSSLGSYYTAAQVDALIPKDYITSTTLTDRLNSYLLITNFNSTIANYSTTAQMNQAISEAAVVVDAAMNNNSTNPVQNKVVMQHVTDSISAYSYSKSEVDKKITDAVTGGTVDLSGYMAKDHYDSNDDNIVNAADKLAKTINAGATNEIQNYAYIEFDTSYKPVYRYIDNAAAEPTDTSTRLALLSDLSNYYTKTETEGLGYITNTNLNTALNSYYKKTDTYSSTEIDTNITNAVNSVRVTIDSAMSADSANPVQNKVIKQYVDDAVSGVGDMKKSTYDKDNDGVIDSALKASQLYTSDAASNQDYTLLIDGEGQVLFKTHNTTSQATTTQQVAFKDQIPDAYTKTQVDNLISSPQITGDTFKIQDSSSNTILQADANGLSTTKVTAEEIEVREEDNTYNVGKSLQRINQRLDAHSHTPRSILGDGGTDDQLLISVVGDDPTWIDPAEYLGAYSVTRNEMKILTSAPTAANNTGIMKFVVLESEPATRYNGYLYIITG